MQALFNTGLIIDFLLAAFAVEAIIVGLWLRRSGRGIAGFLASLAAGACLLLGIRAALIGSDWPWVALWIGLSLPFHLADLASRRHGDQAKAEPGNGRTSKSAVSRSTSGSAAAPLQRTR